jgi:hypothetical protein
VNIEIPFLYDVLIKIIKNIKMINCRQNRKDPKEIKGNQRKDPKEIKGRIQRKPWFPLKEGS